MSSGRTVVDDVVFVVKLRTKFQHLACLCLHCNVEVLLTLCPWVTPVVMYAVTVFVLYWKHLGPRC